VPPVIWWIGKWAIWPWEKQSTVVPPAIWWIEKEELVEEMKKRPEGNGRRWQVNG